MKILALDLGTKTGWALYDAYPKLPDMPGITSGTWVLAKPAEVKRMRAADLDRCCDIRAARLRECIVSVGPVDAIYFEDVTFSTTTLQTQMWGSLRAVVWLETSQALGPKGVAVPVATLKKFATGKGNADKAHMLEAAIKQGFKSIGADDNEVDAWHLLQFALKNGTNL